MFENKSPTCDFTIQSCLKVLSDQSMSPTEIAWIFCELTEGVASGGRTGGHESLGWAPN